jgi:signal transduction histidine kinase
MSELALKSARNPDTVNQLEKISRTARDVVDNISQIVWALNPKNDKLDNLMGYVREHALEFFEGTSIQCRCEFPDQWPDMPMTVETRRNVFLAVKEALNNAARHSRATQVILSITQTPAGLSFLIQDNGIGFDMFRRSQFGNGVTNMRKRIEEIGGSFEAHSEPGMGTKVHMTLPFGEG